MRIERIALRDFRGIGTAEVTFDPDGVTVVEGPNEVGKTSLADAFIMLLDAKDSSGKQHVKAAQPIGRDVGPFVEAEFTVGPYRLVYRKQWLKGKLTELEIIEPAPEQLTGEDAHNRMETILEDETDLALFRALRYQQGVAISQANVSDVPSLAAALDAAAGSADTAGSTASDNLMARVEQERLSYFTDKGGIPIARKAKGERLGELEGEILDVEGKIWTLDEAAERQGRLDGKIRDLSQREPDTIRDVEERRRAVAAIEQIERRAQGARHEYEQAQTAVSEARRIRDARAHLIAADAAAARALADLEADIGAAAPGLAEAEARLAEAEATAAATRTAWEDAEQEAAQRRGYADLLNVRLERDQLRERHDRVLAADEDLANAERFLARCVVDEAVVSQINDAVDTVVAARARAEAGHARVAVEALKPIQVIVDGERTDAVPGTPIEASVSAQVDVTIADVARVVISPPDANDGAVDALPEAERHLERLLTTAGVDSRDAAAQAFRERSRNETERNNAAQRRADAIRDLEPAVLAAKLGRADERLAMLEAEHGPSTDEATAREAAETDAAHAKEQAQTAREQAEKGQAAVRTEQAAVRVLQDSSLKQVTRREGAEAEAQRAADELDQSRATTADSDVEQAVTAAETLDAAKLAVCEAIDQELAAGDPQTARTMLENAEMRREREAKELHDCQLESASNLKQLELGGLEGLSDRLAEALAAFEDLQRGVDSENRRAAAAQRLHQVLSAQRDQAQQAYIGPFREKVNGYARILYGPEVTVEIDHRTFAVVSRTKDGTTVPFDRLSGGAKEQLAVLARLACGALVSPHGESGGGAGVPVIIDDALGYSDPERLEQLGAALTAAGKDCQVIVLTCEPGRYRSVGGATVVPLA